ncbi:MAG: Holliday junction resolvase RuvX [Spirochaetales bacterium]|nr:Holliday junction resolvase RuvX [Spirochaetales bacterium]
MGRILAVDLGTRRVGLAVTDPLKILASPLRTVPYGSRRRLVETLAAVVRELEVETVVIGLPVGLDGDQDREVCRRSRNVAQDLAERGINAVLWDERYSSLSAEETLRSLGARRRNAPGQVDRVAAAIILREYLDENPSRGAG